MEFRDSLAAQLPSRRDDEPPSLRQDILDELADHLACAYKRELLRGAEATVAQARVLEQFGDPAAVARRLWFDAMKGKIMTQRVLIGACLLLSVVVCGAALALERQQSLRAAREAAEANYRLAQALAQSQATNQEMLSQLRTMAEAFRSGQTPDWIPVSFKLTQETLDGPPAVGYEVALGRGTAGGIGGMGAGNSGYTEVIHRVSDDNGLVDFGVVQPGDWQFDLVRRWKGPGVWSAHGSLNVLPGTKITKSIICPKAPPETGPVTLRVAWPADLAAKQYLVEASITHQGITYQTPLHWTLGHMGNNGWPSTRRILCELREGQIKQADLGPYQTFYYWQFANPTGVAVDFGSEKRDPTQLFADLCTKSVRLDATAAKLDVGNYNLNGLVFLRSRPRHQLKIPGERFDVLAYTAFGQWGWSAALPTFNIVYKPPDDGEPTYPPGAAMGEGQNESAAKSKFVAVSDSFWQGNDAHFAVQRGAPNGWTIQLPDEIIKFLREPPREGQSVKSKAG